MKICNANTCAPQTLQSRKWRQHQADMTRGKEIVLLPRYTEKEQDSLISGNAEVKLQKSRSLYSRVI